MSTDPSEEVWVPGSSRGRREEVSAVVGRGDATWERASEDLLHWRVKTRSGFAVDDAAAVRPGARPTITALRGLVVEPVEVVEVVERADRVGFSYRTLPGHPVHGEEAFVLSRRGDVVLLTVRSLTSASAAQPWRALFPLLLVAQRIAHRRYLRALG